MPSEFAQVLRHEESIYSILTLLQGIRVPVALGSLNLRRTFSYNGIAEIGHFLFLSHVGRPIKEHRIDHQRLMQETEDSIKAIHKLGVLHSDPNAANMFWTKRTIEDGYRFRTGMQVQQQNPLVLYRVIKNANARRVLGK